jgi:3-phenylpropionate/trans-cinnamate dioxygenase ferredoxin component
MSESVFLCRTDELSSGQAKRFDVAGHRIALVRTEDEFHAVADRCSHENYSLAEGEVWVEEREIECPRHGSTFDLLTGSPVHSRPRTPWPSTKWRSRTGTSRWCCHDGTLIRRGGLARVGRGT